MYICTKTFAFGANLPYCSCMEQTKKCSKCLAIKLLCAFGKNARNKDGLFSVCKECVNRKSRERYANNEYVRAAAEAYRRTRIEETKAYNKRYKKDNPSKISVLRKKYKSSIRGKLACSRYRERNREKILEKSRLYHHANKHREHIYKVNYYKTRPSARRDQKHRSVGFLHNGYVAYLIARRTGVSASQIPHQFVDAKRHQIKLKRLIKELKK